MHRALFICILLLLAGCRTSADIEPISFGKEACHYCKMVIVDPRFGAEIVTQKGKVYKFDSIECMANHIEKNTDHAKGIAYVQNSFDSKKLIPVNEAFFYHDSIVRSPMGKGIFAGTTRTELQHNSSKSESVILWPEVLKLVGQQSLLSLFQQ